MNAGFPPSLDRARPAQPAGRVPLPVDLERPALQTLPPGSVLRPGMRTAGGVPGAGGRCAEGGGRRWFRALAVVPPEHEEPEGDEAPGLCIRPRPSVPPASYNKARTPAPWKAGAKVIF